MMPAWWLALRQFLPVGEPGVQMRVTTCKPWPHAASACYSRRRPNHTDPGVDASEIWTMETPPDETPKKPRPAAGARLAARRNREADALRANLRKRKDQVRAREKPKQE